MMGSMSAPGVVSTNGLHRVELSLPADAHMLFLARMTAAAVATRAELDYEQVEDLRLAIDELCITLLGSGVNAGQIALLFQWDGDGVLDVVGTLIPESDPAAKDDGSQHAGSALSSELSQRILDALVDDHGADAIGGVHRAWLRVRRREASQ
jgi:serine/threonine-protein kinase RsbW